METGKHSTRPIRVLQVIGGMNRGGIETWLMHVLRHLTGKCTGTLLAEPDSFRRKALSEQLLAIISATASDNRSSERLSLIDRRTVEASAKGNYRPLAASPSPSCSRRLSGSARSVIFDDQ